MEVHVRPVDLHCEAKAVLGILFLPAFEANSRGPFWLLLLELVGNGGNWGMLLLDVVKFNISLESNSYRVIHHTAFYFGICLSMTLILAALLSSAATVRESQLLTAMLSACLGPDHGGISKLDGIFLFCSGLLRIDPSCLLEIHPQHGGGRQHDGCVRSCVRGGEEERLQLQKARADCHPRSSLTNQIINRRKGPPI
ncbi:tetraspanin-32 isoform X8 [Larus michahellis]|uniref:tetraspanin-32 isoform X8 n=1 Tax=Larus michahellis TaxID=119627 RepID=UPI003D9B4E1C